MALKDGANGDIVPVCIHGVCKVKTGGAISLGKAIKSDDNARAVMLSDQAVNEGGTNSYTIYYARKAGIALQAASAADDWILAFVCK